jgi:cysteine-rich repeat protein
VTKRTTFARMRYSKANLSPITRSSLCKALVMMVVMVAAVLGGFGCQVYDSARLGPMAQADASNPGAWAGDSSPSGEGECGGGVCWWSQLHDGCASAGMPGEAGRPLGSGDDSASLPPLYFAFTRVALGESSLEGGHSDTAWQTFGFDLDGRCTNSSTCSTQPDTQSCRAPTAILPFDGERCRDNTFARLQPIAAAVPEVGERFRIGESVFNCNLHRGSYNMLWKLSGYNGKPDDSEVRVDFYTTLGLSRLPPWQCPLENYERYPIWRTVESWRIDPAYLDGPIESPGTLPDSTAADPHAYVRGGYLIARPPDGALTRFATADNTRERGFALRAQQPIWTGRLSREQDATWRIRDGLAAGRLLGADVIRSFRQVGLCEGGENDGFYQPVVEYIQQNLDVLSDGTTDPDRDCDAMSFAIAFEAAQATPGDVVPAASVPPLVECCAPGIPVEDCTPTCGDGRLNGDEKCDIAIGAGPGSCPTACSPIDACRSTRLVGTGCDTACEALPIPARGADDGCCPPGATASNDPDCRRTCGNGVVEMGETCDPPASCPRCEAVADRCLEVMQSGSRETCDVVCQHSIKSACVAEDGCCPGGCSSDTDSDCSSTCGDGSVDARETCETSGARPCQEDCDDDDPCTADYRTGSAANCNVTCTHVAVAFAESGDRCCPSASTEIACGATCGDGTREDGEDCDDGNVAAGDGCGPDCKTESLAEQCSAGARAGAARGSDACAACVCDACAAEAIACFAPVEAGAAEECAAVVDCGIEHGCSGTDCFCGTAGLLACVRGGANGPCVREIQAASGSQSVSDVMARSADAEYPIGRANALALCREKSCAEACAGP